VVLIIATLIVGPGLQATVGYGMVADASFTVVTGGNGVQAIWDISALIE
jgi:hypothetical protein